PRGRREASAPTRRCRGRRAAGRGSAARRSGNPRAACAHRASTWCSQPRSHRTRGPLANQTVWGLFRDAGFESGLQRVAHRLELDTVEDLLVEAAHDQALGLAAGKAAGHAVEELVAVDLADGRAVGAANVVRLDLEAGDRVGVSLVGEE